MAVAVRIDPDGTCFAVHIPVRAGVDLSERNFPGIRGSKEMLDVHLLRQGFFVDFWFDADFLELPPNKVATELLFEIAKADPNGRDFSSALPLGLRGSVCVKQRLEDFFESDDPAHGKLVPPEAPDVLASLKAACGLGVPFPPIGWRPNTWRIIRNVSPERPLHVGARIEVQGLVNASQHNGYQGFVVQRDEAKNRWGVVLDHGKRGPSLSVKETNLLVVQRFDLPVPPEEIDEDGAADAFETASPEEKAEELFAGICSFVPAPEHIPPGHELLLEFPVECGGELLPNVVGHPVKARSQHFINGNRFRAWDAGIEWTTFTVESGLVQKNAVVRFDKDVRLQRCNVNCFALGWRDDNDPVYVHDLLGETQRIWRDRALSQKR